MPGRPPSGKKQSESVQAIGACRLARKGTTEKGLPHELHALRRIAPLPAASCARGIHAVPTRFCCTLRLCILRRLAGAAGPNTSTSACQTRERDSTLSHSLGHSSCPAAYVPSKQMTKELEISTLWSKGPLWSKSPVKHPARRSPLKSKSRAFLAFGATLLAL